MRKLILAVCCIGLLSACSTVPMNELGLKVYLPYEDTFVRGAEVHLDECAYFDDLKEFVCPHTALRPDEDTDE